MNTATRLTVYGVTLALVATGAWAIGTAVGPVSDAAGTPAAPATETHGDTVTASSEGPDGLASAKDGYLLQPTGTTFAAGTTTPFSFRITRSDGSTLTTFDTEHTKQLHLIVVRRDLSGFQHLHPEMAADGTWTVPLTLPHGGSYRALADFKPTAGAKLTLGVDLTVPGDFQPVTHSDSSISIVDGYEVQLDGKLTPGGASRLALTVTRGGQGVTDLQPYLAAYGHLVALRVGDLAYVHVHPDENTTAGPTVHFTAEVPSSGTYRLFLDFKHGGKVRTADFTLTADGATAPARQTPKQGGGHGSDGHGH